MKDILKKVVMALVLPGAALIMAVSTARRKNRKK